MLKWVVWCIFVWAANLLICLLIERKCIYCTWHTLALSRQQNLSLSHSSFGLLNSISRITPSLHKTAHHCSKKKLRATFSVCWTSGSSGWAATVLPLTTQKFHKHLSLDLALTLVMFHSCFGIMLRRGPVILNVFLFCRSHPVVIKFQTGTDQHCNFFRPIEAAVKDIHETSTIQFLCLNKCLCPATFAWISLLTERAPCNMV